MGQYDPKKPSAFNIVNILIVLVLLSVGYLGWFYIPHWWPVFRMTSVMSGIANDAYRQFDDEKLLKKLIEQSSRTGLRGLNEQNFSISREPYPVDEMSAKLSASTTPDHARKILEQRGKFVHVDFHFEVDAKWPLRSGKFHHLVFDKRVTQNLETIQY